MENLNWYFDAAIGVVMLGFIIQGIRKGFSKIIVPFVLNLVFVILAFFTSGFVADTLYENVIEDSVQTSVDEAVEKFDLTESFNRQYEELTLIGEASEKEIASVLSSEKNMDAKFWKLIDKTSGVGDTVNESACFTALNNIIKVSLQESISKSLPSCSGKYFEHLNEANEDETFLILSMMYSDRKEASKYIADTCIHDTMFKFIKLVCFVVMSAVLMILTGIIFSIAYKDRGAGAEGAGDAAAGVLIELVNGLMVIMVLAVLVKIMIYSGIQIDNIADDNTLNNSYVFKYLYNIDKFMPGSRM